MVTLQYYFLPQVVKKRNVLEKSYQYQTPGLTILLKISKGNERTRRK